MRHFSGIKTKRQTNSWSHFTDFSRVTLGMDLVQGFCITKLKEFTLLCEEGRGLFFLWWVRTASKMGYLLCKSWPKASWRHYILKEVMLEGEGERGKRGSKKILFLVYPKIWRNAIDIQTDGISESGYWWIGICEDHLRPVCNSEHTMVELLFCKMWQLVVIWINCFAMK